jgi:hypothetical protein
VKEDCVKTVLFFLETYVSFVVKAPIKFDPPLWAEYEERHKVAALTPYFNKAADVNRFQARYRLARAFRGLLLEGYSDTTKAGYDALTKVSLYWSAFEQMMYALHIPDPRYFLGTYKFVLNLKKIEDVDSERKFFGFVRDKIDRKDLKSKLKTYIDSGSGNVFLLAKCVRHIYLHGHLTANVRGLSPQDIASICDFLCEALLKVMDAEFEARVLDLKKVYE